MPKYKPSTQKLKAKNLIKPYIKSGFNQAKLARKRGVKPSTINEQIHQPAVQKTMAQLLDNIGLSDKCLGAGLKEGVNADKRVPFVGSVPDYSVRHKYIVTCLELKGHIKHNGNGKGISVINLIYGHRPVRSNDSSIREGQPEPAALTQ